MRQGTTWAMLLERSHTKPRFFDEIEMPKYS